MYGIIIFPLSQYFRELDPTLLSPFYSNDAVFNGFASRRAVQLKILMARGTDRGYFRDPSKSLFIADNPEDEEGIRAGGPKPKLCWWNMIPGGLLGAQKVARGMGTSQSGGMVSQALHSS